MTYSNKVAGKKKIIYYGKIITVPEEIDLLNLIILYFKAY